jgi:DNA-binding response OmpR family regulator
MPKKILFVEDDENFFNVFSVPLRMKGYDVVHVADGAVAMEKALLEKPDLVLLDIILCLLNFRKRSEYTLAIPAHPE